MQGHTRSTTESKLHTSNADTSHKQRNSIWHGILEAVVLVNINGKDENVWVLSVLLERAKGMHRDSESNTNALMSIKVCTIMFL